MCHRKSKDLGLSYCLINNNFFFYISFQCEVKLGFSKLKIYLRGFKGQRNILIDFIHKLSLLFPQLSLSFLHVNLLFFHVNLLFLQISLLFLCVSLLFINVSLLFLQSNLLFFHISSFFLHVSLLFFNDIYYSSM